MFGRGRDVDDDCSGCRRRRRILARARCLGDRECNRPGFAADIGDFIDAGVEDIRIGEISTLDVRGARYATVEVDFPFDAARRVFVLTDRNGWRVDLVATFPGAFVANIPLAVERASSPGVDPGLIASIRRQDVSLDALEAIGVDERTAEAIAEARESMGITKGG